MPAPAGPPQISTMTSCSRMSPSLMAWMAASSDTNTRAGPRWRKTPSWSIKLGSIEVLFTTEPSGVRLPWGKQTVAVRPRARALAGAMITSSGSMPSRSCRFLRSAWRRGLCSHQLRLSSSVWPGDGFDFGVEQAGSSQVEHHFGEPSCEEDLDCSEIARAVGQGIDQARNFAVHVRPVRGDRAFQSGGVGDGGQVEQQIGGASECGVGDHGVFERGLGEDVVGSEPELVQAQKCLGGTTCGVKPDGCS